MAQGLASIASHAEGKVQMITLRPFILVASSRSPLSI